MDGCSQSEVCDEADFASSLGEERNGGCPVLFGPLSRCPIPTVKQTTNEKGSIVYKNNTLLASCGEAQLVAVGPPPPRRQGGAVRGAN